MKNENSEIIRQKIDDLFKDRTEALLTKFTYDVDQLESWKLDYTEVFHRSNYTFHNFKLRDMKKKRY